MKDRFKLVLLIWVVIIIIIGLISCNPEKKIQKAISTVKSADRLDDLCAAEYPCKENYIKGDTVTVYDTLWGVDRTDTFLVNDTVFIQRTSKPITIVKTKVVIDTVQIRDLAFESMLKGKLDSVSMSNFLLIKDKGGMVLERDKYKGRSRTYLWILIALATVLFSRTFYNIYRWIKPVAK